MTGAGFLGLSAGATTSVLSVAGAWGAFSFVGATVSTAFGLDAALAASVVMGAGLAVFAAGAFGSFLTVTAGEVGSGAAGLPV